MRGEFFVFCWCKKMGFGENIKRKRQKINTDTQRRYVSETGRLTEKRREGSGMKVEQEGKL